MGDININESDLERLDRWRMGNYYVKIFDGYLNYEQVKDYIIKYAADRINKETQGPVLTSEQLEELDFAQKHWGDITKVIKEDVKEKNLQKEIKILQEKLADFAKIIDKNTRRLNERLSQVEEVIEDKFNYTFPELTEE